MRTPTDIAADLRELHDTASKAFVPVNLVKAMELNVEFSESTAAAIEQLQAAVVPAPTPAPEPAPAPAA